MRNSSIRLFGSDGFLLKFATRHEINDLIIREQVEEVVYQNKFLGFQLHDRRASSTSPCQLTAHDTLVNAGIVNSDRGNPYPNLTQVNRVRDKVNAWPVEFDKRNVTISAGRAHGVFFYCPWPRRNFQGIFA